MYLNLSRKGLENFIFLQKFEISFYRNHFYCILFNTLNAKLNLICHLLALLEAHHILHVSRIRVNSLGSKKGNMQIF